MILCAACFKQPAWETTHPTTCAHVPNVQGTNDPEQLNLRSDLFNEIRYCFFFFTTTKQTCHDSRNKTCSHPRFARCTPLGDKSRWCSQPHVRKDVRLSDRNREGGGKLHRAATIWLVVNMPPFGGDGCCRCPHCCWRWLPLHIFCLLCCWCHHHHQRIRERPPTTKEAKATTTTEGARATATTNRRQRKPTTTGGKGSHHHHHHQRDRKEHGQSYVNLEKGQTRTIYGKQETHGKNEKEKHMKMKKIKTTRMKMNREKSKHKNIK